MKTSPNFPDVSGHHLVYGELADFLTGETLKDTDDERVRQRIFRLLVEELGYTKGELEPRPPLVSRMNGKTVISRIEVCARIEGQRLWLLRYGPGSLVTREKPAVAAARVLEADYRIPFAIVTNGRDAEVLDTANSRVLASGMHAIPNRKTAGLLRKQAVFTPCPPFRQDQARRILAVFDEEVCCAGCHERQISKNFSPRNST